MRPTIVILVALAACARPEREAARAVREYDDALVVAYRTGDASSMTQVAATKEAQRVQVLVDLKSSGKLVLESTLEAFEATRVQIGPSAGAATVETKERWRYSDRHLRPGEPPGPTFVSDMTMRYDLVRDDGRWKVRDVTTIANEYLGRSANAERTGHADHRVGASPERTGER
jgi:hypothetical protein